MKYLLRSLVGRLGQSGQTRARVAFAGATDIGRKRKNNEDSFGGTVLKPGVKTGEHGSWPGGLKDGGLLLVVSDGMGGARGGEVASRLALTHAAAEFFRIDGVPGDETAGAAAEAAVVRVHEAIFRASQGEPQLRGMGATFCGWWFRPGERRAWLLNVGDSRAYRWRNGELTQLSRDQTQAQGMVDRGEMTAEQAARSRLHSILEHALGADGRPIEPQVRAVDIAEGDMLLLCSDGLHGAMAHEALARLLPRRVTPGALPLLAKKMVLAARDASGADNITVVLAHVGALP